jgi:hypothetical protein
MHNLTLNPKISKDNSNNKMKTWYKISILIFKDKIQIRQIIDKVKCIRNKGKMSTLMIIM